MQTLLSTLNNLAAIGARMYSPDNYTSSTTYTGEMPADAIPYRVVDGPTMFKVGLNPDKQAVNIMQIFDVDVDYPDGTRRKLMARNKAVIKYNAPHVEFVDFAVPEGFEQAMLVPWTVVGEGVIRIQMTSLVPLYERPIDMLPLLVHESTRLTCEIKGIKSLIVAPADAGESPWFNLPYRGSKSSDQSLNMYIKGLSTLPSANEVLKNSQKVATNQAYAWVFNARMTCEVFTQEELGVALAHAEAEQAGYETAIFDIILQKPFQEWPTVTLDNLIITMKG